MRPRALVCYHLMTIIIITKRWAARVSLLFEREALKWYLPWISFLSFFFTCQLIIIRERERDNIPPRHASVHHGYREGIFIHTCWRLRSKCERKNGQFTMRERVNRQEGEKDRWLVTLRVPPCCVHKAFWHESKETQRTFSPSLSATGCPCVSLSFLPVRVTYCEKRKEGSVRFSFWKCPRHESESCVCKVYICTSGFSSVYHSWLVQMVQWWSLCLWQGFCEKQESEEISVSLSRVCSLCEYSL